MVVIKSTEEMKKYLAEQKKIGYKPKYWTAMREMGDVKHIWMIEQHENLKEAQKRYETMVECIGREDFMIFMEIPTKINVQFPKMDEPSFEEGGE